MAFNESAEQENLINLETKYYDLEINGKKLGAHVSDGILTNYSK